MNGVTDHLYKGAFDCDTRIQIGCFGGSHEVAFFHEFKDGVDWVSGGYTPASVSFFTKLPTFTGA